MNYSIYRCDTYLLSFFRELLASGYVLIWVRDRSRSFASIVPIGSIDPCRESEMGIVTLDEIHVTKLILSCVESELLPCMVLPMKQGNWRCQ